MQAKGISTSPQLPNSSSNSRISMGRHTLRVKFCQSGLLASTRIDSTRVEVTMIELEVTYRVTVQLSFLM